MTTRQHQLRITNDGKAPMVFQIEPECHQFTIFPNENVVVLYEYDEEPPELRLGETTDPVFGAIFPGDGDLIVKKNGRNVLDEK